jgi:hypothetical protein
MKLAARLIGLMSMIIAFGITMFGTVTPVAAGCNNELTIDSVNAYRDHIIIHFTVNKLVAYPIEFTVSDQAAIVGSTTFSNVTTGSFTVELDLASTVVHELDKLDVEGSPDIGCNQFASAVATGFYYSNGVPTQRFTPQCPDGRINYNNCDKIAIYPTADEGSFGIQVYVVDHKTVPSFGLFVSAADLNALPANPDKVITIAQSKDGLVILYKHPNGDYQVNYGPDFEGKVFTFRFNSLPAVQYPEVTTFMIGALMPRLMPEIG